MTDPAVKADGKSETGPSGSGRRISFGVIFLVLFLDLVGFGILFPLYPEMMRHYIAHEPGVLQPLLDLIAAWFPKADEAQRITLFGGVLTGAYAAVQFITSPFWGRI
jgi:MFS family permease